MIMNPGQDRSLDFWNYVKYLKYVLEETNDHSYDRKEEEGKKRGAAKEDEAQHKQVTLNLYKKIQ